MRRLALPFCTFFVLFSFQVFAGERMVSLSWEEVPNVVHYEVEVVDESGQVVKKMKFKKNEFSVPLKVGSYKLRARSFDQRSVTGEWSDYEAIVVPPSKTSFVDLPKQSFVASTKNLQAQVALGWKSVAENARYKIAVYNGEGQLVAEKTDVAETSVSFELPAGEYKAELVSVVNGLQSDEKTEIPFLVMGAKMPPVNLTGLKKTEGGMSVLWGDVITGAAYTGHLERQDVAAEELAPWESIYEFKNLTQEELKLPDELRPGVYRLTIAATAKGWQASPSVKKQFVIKPKQRDLASIESEMNSSYDFTKISN